MDKSLKLIKYVWHPKFYPQRQKNPQIIGATIAYSYDLVELILIKFLNKFLKQFSHRCFSWISGSVPICPPRLSAAVVYQSA